MAKIKLIKKGEHRITYLPGRTSFDSRFRCSRCRRTHLAIHNFDSVPCSPERDDEDDKP